MNDRNSNYTIKSGFDFNVLCHRLPRRMFVWKIILYFIRKPQLHLIFRTYKRNISFTKQTNFDSLNQFFFLMYYCWVQLVEHRFRADLLSRPKWVLLNSRMLLYKFRLSNVWKWLKCYSESSLWIILKLHHLLSFRS